VDAVSRVALVTGAAGGIGRACAERLAADGLTVVSLDREPIADPPGPAIVYDLEQLDGLEAMLDEVVAQAGPVDVLVNNAAMFVRTPVATVSLADLQRIAAVNLFAPMMLAVLAARGMQARGWGRIISISSIKDAFGERETLGYDAAKGGISQATRTLAVELGRHGVLVNAIAPGYVRTGMSVVDGKNELDTDWFRTSFIENGRIPVQRPAAPHEIAACVAWLASDQSSYVNGAVIRIDGGLSVTL
jgi:NAD(P)-dependent dehydrogenase (short-subunit alcohol dehydrogenase family)